MPFQNIETIDQPRNEAAATKQLAHHEKELTEIESAGEELKFWIIGLKELTEMGFRW